MRIFYIMKMRIFLPFSFRFWTKKSASGVKSELCLGDERRVLAHEPGEEVGSYLADKRRLALF